MIAAVWSEAGSRELEAVVADLSESFGPPQLMERRGARVSDPSQAAGALLGWRGLRQIQQLRGGIALGPAHRSAETADGNVGWVGFRSTGDGIEGERGAVGGEPIYWGRCGSSWVVGSRLELLLALRRGGRRSFDVAQMAFVLAVERGALPSAMVSTPYEGISRLLSSDSVELPPRSSVVGIPAVAVRSARARKARARGLDASPLTGSSDGLAETLWDAARQSVARATQGVRVVGVLAGGGVDSSGLLAAVVAHARDRGDLEVVPLAFDFASPGDDRPHRQALEAALGVEAVKVSPEEAGPYLVPSLLADGQPTLHPSIPIVVAAANAGKLRGVERILTGFLGDLVLDVPSTAFYDRAMSGGPLDALGAIAGAILHRTPFSAPGLRRLRPFLIHPVLRALMPSSFVAIRRRRQRRASLPSWAGPVMRATIDRTEPILVSPSTRTPGGRFASLEGGVPVVEQIDTRAQLELLTGVRFAEPWMDTSFVQTVARIPGWRLAHGHQDRGLFRHALRGRVPDSVRLRLDKAHVDPALDRMLTAAGGRDALRSLSEGRRLAALGLVDASTWADCRERFFSRRDDGNIVEDDQDLDADWTAMWNICAAEAMCAAADGFS